MWKVILLVLLFDSEDKLHGVYQPDATYETMEVCEKAGTKLLALPPPGNLAPKGICVNQETREIRILP